MEHEKLNSLYVRYRVDNDQGTFRELYDGLSEHWRKHRSIVLRSGKGDANDALTIFDTVLMRLTQKDNVQDFLRTLMTSLKNARLDFYKMKLRHDSKLEWDQLGEERDEEEGAPTPIILKSEVTPEDEFLSKKKEADQRQLIDFFRSTKTDATTTAIVEAILGAKPDVKDSVIAKSLGLHHEIFKRKLRKLSHQFDANRFGEVRDYLAV